MYFTSTTWHYRIMRNKDIYKVQQTLKEDGCIPECIEEIAWVDVNIGQYHVRKENAIAQIQAKIASDDRSDYRNWVHVKE